MSLIVIQVITVYSLVLNKTDFTHLYKHCQELGSKLMSEDFFISKIGRKIVLYQSAFRIRDDSVGIRYMYSRSTSCLILAAAGTFNQVYWAMQILMKMSRSLMHTQWYYTSVRASALVIKWWWLAYKYTCERDVLF